ncbi:hypothetical protein I316_05775 [Kwoniella heveanensis BCC8398]|uniref:WW domain-containing protein n=1 Tax=Kwoniella heveanensis BCC8398 TaxID=1296120 RepID=A0A1B9GP56_9TREE|nr:hypothetical protein I316_05775 [Kwoniella heveanensis BCC8398]
MADEEVDWDDDWRGTGHESLSATLEENGGATGMDGAGLGVLSGSGGVGGHAGGEDADDVLSLDGDAEGEGIGEGLDEDRTSPKKSSTAAPDANGNGQAATTIISDGTASSTKAPPTGPRKSMTRPTGPRIPSSSSATASATATPAGPRKASAGSPSNASATGSTATSTPSATTGSNGTAGAALNSSVSSKGSTEAGGEAPLPPGWQAIMSKSHQRPFYFHKESNTTVWDRPTAPIATQAKEDVPASPPLQSVVAQNTDAAASASEKEDKRSAEEAGADSSSKDVLSASSKVKAEEKKPPTGPAVRTNTKQADSAAASASATQPSAAALAYASRKVNVGVPSGPSFAKREAERADVGEHARNASRDTRQSDIDRDRRRQREVSPRPSVGQDDRDSKRFRPDDSRRDARPTNDFRHPRSPPRSHPPRGPRQDDFPPRSQSGPRGPLQDDTSRPYERERPSRYPSGDSRTPARSPPPSSRYAAPVPSSGRRPEGRNDTGSGIPTGPGGRYPPRDSVRDRDLPPSRGPASSSSSSRDSAEAVRAQIREEQRKAEARLKFLKDEEDRLARIEAEEKKKQQEEDDRRRRKEEDDRRRREEDDRRRREDEQRSRRDMYPPRPSRRDGPYSPDRRPLAFPPPLPPADRSRYDAYRPDDVSGPPIESRGSSRSYRPISPPPFDHGRYPRGDDGYRRPPPLDDFDRPLSSRIDAPRYRDERDRDFDRPRRPLSPPGGVRSSDPPLSARLGRRSPPPVFPLSARLGPGGPRPRRNGDSYHPDGAEPPRDLASRLGMGGGGLRKNELSAEPMSAQAQDRGRDRDRDRRSPPPPPPPPSFRRDDRSLSARPMAERMSVDPIPGDGPAGGRRGGGGDRYDPREREREWRR